MSATNRTSNTSQPDRSNFFCSDCPRFGGETCKRCMENQTSLASSIFSDENIDDRLVKQSVDILVSRFRDSKNYKDAVDPANAIGFDGAAKYISGNFRENEDSVAKKYGDETGALAAMVFSRELPLHIVHAALSNIGQWETIATGMDENTGDLVVILGRKLFGYSVYITGGDGKWHELLSKNRWFYTEDEAVVFGDQMGEELANGAWAAVRENPVDWDLCDTEDSDEAGFVHLSCLPFGGSIGIKILHA